MYQNRASERAVVGLVNLFSSFVYDCTVKNENERYPIQNGMLLDVGALLKKIIIRKQKYLILSIMNSFFFSLKPFLV